MINPFIEVSNKLKLCVRLYKDMFCSKSAKTNDELISQLKGKLLRKHINECNNTKEPFDP